MDETSRGTGNQGLTLIELMITLVILAVTITAAIPHLQQLVHGNQLRTETSRLLDALNLARSEAVLRNMPVSICPSPMAISGVAACSGQLEGGWIVFTNPARDAVVDAGSDEVIRAFGAIPPGYTLIDRAGISGSERLVTFLPDGSSRRNRTLQLCPPAGLRLESWSVVLNTVGRVRAARGEVECPVHRV